MLHKAKTAQEAIGRWPGILAALGVDAKHLRNRHGPCPICGGKDRFRFDDKEGKGTWFCSHCGAGDGFSLLRKMNGWDFRQAAAEVDRVIVVSPVGAVSTERPEESKLAALRKVWEAAQQVSPGDPVWQYLNRRTGISEIPPDVRYHKSLAYLDQDGKFVGYFPAMVAKLRYPTGAPASLHRTYLTEDGSKAPVQAAKKMMPGRDLVTASVRLGRHDGCLGIAEGIETALSASMRFMVPVWAATTALLLEKWEPPAGITSVLIAGDNDASFTGQAAAYALAKRLKDRGLAVSVHIPEAVNTDWADA